MLLKSLTLQNFKAIGEEPVLIDLKPITLLFGPNSAGKSTIIQSLYYAKEILEKDNLDPAELPSDPPEPSSLDLGGFRTMVNGHDLSRQVTLAFDFELENGELPDYVPPERGWIEESICWQRLRDVQRASTLLEVRWDAKKARHLASYETGVNGKAIARISNTGLDTKFRTETGEEFAPFGTLVYLELNHPLFQTPDGANLLNGLVANLIDPEIFGSYGHGEPGLLSLPFQRTFLPPPGQPLRLAYFKENCDLEQVESLEQLVSSLVVGPLDILRRQLASFRHIGPLRAIPDRRFVPSRRYKEERWRDGRAAWDCLGIENDEFVDEFNKWFAERLGTGYRIVRKRYKEVTLNEELLSALESDDLPPTSSLWKELHESDPKSRLSLRRQRDGLEVFAADLGTGISQLLPVVVGTLTAKDRLVAIEQPELHIHPALQTQLADLFISQISRKSVRFLLETHSEHLILRLLRRIRETTNNELPEGAPPLRPDQVSVMYIDNDEKGFRATNLRIDETGEFIDRWPKGFFVEREEELF